jgi:purine-binding chemotaxis protein CheW
VIVVQIGGRPIGLLADQVLDIIDVDPARIQPVPRIADMARTDFLSGLVNIDSGMVALIDLARLLALSMGTSDQTGTASHDAAA